MFCSTFELYTLLLFLSLSLSLSPSLSLSLSLSLALSPLQQVVIGRWKWKDVCLRRRNDNEDNYDGELVRLLYWVRCGAYACVRRTFVHFKD